MTTQMQFARQGIVTEAMKLVAAQENVSEEFIRQGVAQGTIAICCNRNHKNKKSFAPVFFSFKQEVCVLFISRQSKYNTQGIFCQM